MSRKNALSHEQIKAINRILDLKNLQNFRFRCFVFPKKFSSRSWENTNCKTYLNLCLSKRYSAVFKLVIVVTINAVVVNKYRQVFLSTSATLPFTTENNFSHLTQ